MIRKLDILMIKSFIGPFLLTTAVSNFILLIQYMLKYFDDFVGKNLGFTVFAELLFYFSLNMLQVALPLGVLVASLMTFGNLGENFELTAIKGSGISLLRTLRPIFLFVVLLSIGAFYFNNYAVPAANLKAYSLLYDIKHTKPALDIKAGTFYNGIPNYSIYAKDKLPDGRTLLDVLIYDHSQGRGNKTTILSDSSLMYTILDDRYLKLELYNGSYYAEQPKSKSKIDQLIRTKYYRMDMVFSLASFDLKRRKEELFQNNRQMKNIGELTTDIDSFSNLVLKSKQNFIENVARSFRFHADDKEGFKIQPRKQEEDTVGEYYKKRYQSASLFPVGLFEQKLPPKGENQKRPSKFDLTTIPSHGVLEDVIPDMFIWTDTASADTAAEELLAPIKQELLLDRRVEKKVLNPNLKKQEEETFLLDTAGWAFLEERIANNKILKRKVIYSNALNQARSIKVNVQSAETKMKRARKDINLYTIEKYKKYAQAMACIVMFMIGAPLGAIIKKGGLGVPTIIAIFFFIIYYVFTSIGEKSAKEGVMNPYFAVWLSDLVLLPFGLLFLRQARVDARLFDVDFYRIWIDKLKTRFAKNKKEV